MSETERSAVREAAGAGGGGGGPEGRKKAQRKSDLTSGAFFYSLVFPTSSSFS